MILASINKIALITRARVCLHLNDLGRQKLMPGNFACRNEQSVPKSSPPKKEVPSHQLAPPGPLTMWGHIQWRIQSHLQFDHNWTPLPTFYKSVLECIMQYLFHLISRHQVLVLPPDLSGHVLMSFPHPPESQAIVGAPEMQRFQT